VGIDLVVVRASSPEGAQQDVGDLRAVPKASAAPVLVAASGPDFPELKRMYRRNQRVKVVSWGTEEAFAAAVDDLLRQAAGGRMDEAEAEIYAIEALTTLRDIAVSRCGAYSMADAEPALIDALFLRKGGTRMLVAKILAMIDSPRAQRTLFDAAITAEGGEQLELLGYVSDSVKRFGSHAEPRHVAALRQLVADSTGELAEGAARVHGALNLPVSGTVDLLP
jgi:hypothetical protein